MNCVFYNNFIDANFLEIYKEMATNTFCLSPQTLHFNQIFNKIVPEEMTFKTPQNMANITSYTKFDRVTYFELQNTTQSVIKETDKQRLFQKPIVCALRTPNGYFSEELDTDFVNSSHNFFVLRILEMYTIKMIYNTIQKQFL